LKEYGEALFSITTFIARLKNMDEELTPEQEAAITEALKLASFTDEESSDSPAASPVHHEEA
jgi:hypothetical protein